MKKFGTNFWIFFTGQSLSFFGDACGFLALGWFLMSKTGSPTGMAAILSSSVVLSILTGVVAGPIVDRFSRVKLCFYADILRFVAWTGMALAAYFDSSSLALYGTLFLLSSLGTGLFEASITPLIPQLTPAEFLDEGLRIAQTMNAGCGILGSLLGGLLASSLGPVPALLLNATSFLVAALSSVILKNSPEKVKLTAGSLRLTSWLLDFKQGCSAVLHQPALKAVALFAGLTTMLTTPVRLAILSLVQGSANIPDWFTGVANASIALGSASAFLAMKLLRGRLSSVQTVVLCQTAMGLGLCLLGIRLHLAVLIFGAMLLGIGMAQLQMSILGQLLRTIPDAWQGRIFSIFGLVEQAHQSVGFIVGGLVIDRFGPSVFLWGAGSMVLAMLPLIRLEVFKGFLSPIPQPRWSDTLEPKPEGKASCT